MKQSIIQLPYKLTLRRIYILPTRYGTLFLVLIFAMLVGAVNYNNNLGFLLAFLLGSMGVVSVIHTYRNFSGIQIVSARCSPVFAEENAVFEFLVRVEGDSRAAVKFGFDAEKHRHLVDLIIGKDNYVRVNRKTDRRGILSPGVLRISTRYPFGLFRAWCNIQPDIGCLVYPKPLQERFRYATAGDELKDDGRGGARAGADDFQGLSIYQPGDSPRHISWKAYSKGQGVLVKKFEGRAGTATLIDWGKLKASDPEKKLSILCGMILHADMLKTVYSLKIKGIIVPPGNSGHHKHRCLRVLALFDPETQ